VSSGGKDVARHAEISRKTRETDIRVRLLLDGSGESEISTGLAFFDHMLESFAKHSLFDLYLTATGDLLVDAHHTVEDVGIALGQALRQALGSADGIKRFGFWILPMAEAKVEVALDLSNRPYFVYDVKLDNNRVGTFDISLVEDFLHAFVQNAGIDLHVTRAYGKSPHHVIEAVFKGLARALREAVARDPRVQGVPSVKGAL